MTADGRVYNADGTVSTYVMGDAGPQRWTFGEPVEHEPGCGCWECLTTP